MPVQEFVDRQIIALAGLIKAQKTAPHGGDLVRLVESGEISGPRARRTVATHVRPLVDAGADTLILGCTHFPFLRKMIEAEAGPAVTVIDTGPAVARQVHRRLGESGLLAGARGGITLFTSGDAARFSAVARRLCPGAPDAVPLD